MVMHRRTLKTLAIMLLMMAMFAVAERPAAAQAIGWMERYALSVDRESKLSE
jgi:MFS superfamily sulfate permease-like transporter